MTFDYSGYNLEKIRKYIVLFLLIGAATIPRFYDLGGLGFYADEETTSFASRSYALNGIPTMPSGMPYYRALPHTWMNAVSASYFGLDNEFSYRLPSAILGVLTVILIYLFSKKLFGDPIAIVAAVLLAFSEWHIQESREARMYGPFLLFYMTGGFATLIWSTTSNRNWAILALVLLIASISFHLLGVMGILFALIPIAFANMSKVKSLQLVVFAIFIAALAFSYDKLIVKPPFTEWININKMGASAGNETELAIYIAWLPNPLHDLLPIAGFVFFLGLFTGSMIVKCHHKDIALPSWSLRTIALYACAALSGAFAFLGQLYGASIVALLFLLIFPENVFTLWKKSWKWIITIFIVMSIWVIWSVITLGLFDGIKQLMMIPFPYPAFLLQMLLGVFILFIIGAIYYALRRHYEEENMLIACVLAVLLPIVAMGIATKWGAMRYLVMIYPFVLVVAAAMLVGVIRYFGARFEFWNRRIETFVAVCIASSGVLGAHGIPQAVKAASIKENILLNNPLVFHGRSYYPDHKTAGAFVRDSLQSDDIVIAEDYLQQTWYLGHVDYALTGSTKHMGKFNGNKLSSIYVSSLMATPQDLVTLTNENKNRIWIVTSAERLGVRDISLSPEQKNWIENIEMNYSPVFTGQDGITRVYCMNCSETLGNDG